MTGLETPDIRGKACERKWRGHQGRLEELSDSDAGLTPGEGREVGWTHAGLQGGSRRSAGRPSGTSRAKAAWQRAPETQEWACFSMSALLSHWPGADMGSMAFTLKQWRNHRADEMSPMAGDTLQWETWAMPQGCHCLHRPCPFHYTVEPLVFPWTSSNPHHHFSTVFH